MRPSGLKLASIFVIHEAGVDAGVTAMSIRDIPRDRWRDELDSFSRQHEGWLVSLTIRQPDGASTVEARDLPLQGVSAASTQSDDIAILIGGGPKHIAHDVRHPVGLALDLTTDGAKRALLIHGGDGTTTSVEFRSPMRPEDVDGLPATTHT
jgi:hypothetical protein